MPRAARDVCTVTAPSCSVRGARRYVTLVERGRIVEPSSVMVDSFTRFLTAFLYSSWCRRRHLWSQNILPVVAVERATNKLGGPPNVWS